MCPAILTRTAPPSDNHPQGLLNPLPDAVVDLVADLSKLFEPLPVGPLECGRVFKWPVKVVHREGKDARAALLCSLANGDRVVHGLLAEELVEPLRAEAPGVDTHVGQYPERHRVDVFRVQSRAASLDLIPGVVTEQSLGHLAPRGIARAKKQYDGPSLCHTFSDGFWTVEQLHVANMRVAECTRSK